MGGKTVKVHIKPPFGPKRTENWSIEKLGDVSDDMIINGNAYAISFFENGEEQFAVTKKYMWDIQGDLTAWMMGDESDYADLTRFCEKVLTIIYGYISEYIDVEKDFFSQKLFDEYPYEETLNKLESLGGKNEKVNKMISGVEPAIRSKEPQTEVMLAIKIVILSMQASLIVHSNSIDYMRILLMKLHKKAQGGRYNMFSYKKDLKNLQKNSDKLRGIALQLSEAQNRLYESHNVK